jgi:hypothetical protein
MRLVSVVNHTENHCHFERGTRRNLVQVHGRIMHVVEDFSLSFEMTSEIVFKNGLGNFSYFCSILNTP